MKNTSEQFDLVAAQCADIFTKKARDYGTAWRILRPSAVTDQIFIKAHRIRSIQIKGEAKINEGIIPEFIGIVNYSIMALIQLEKGFEESEQSTLQLEEIEKLYHKYMHEAKMLMMDKNHDYGEAWRQMRISSLDDIILMKLMRVKQIEDNDGKTVISEGLDANYFDIINYAMFALIRLIIENE
ncbi:DUF1599 domain-containing protein [Bacteroidales bacterium OttesenSCG-928-B11]|nr:DUF1599 domain-containing protein [Bacteroidales bacterium OttesenSCG-928-E04]MDL2308776.1 DUF1599 domain-containing protein [Bacteroidales bacterium OttesenSCG-928-C03]MDL2312659.1 DUF1599 domain-containing protein [Bacteroidales bacterium OttesenSCG-928-B11]MDL2326090.1 DUF1599 domain-containing protein [Bacteroidales bacterium OttesenSCG-928-A14]